MSEDDPFDDLEEDVGDREGDPFQQLDTDSDEQREGETAPAQSPWEDQQADSPGESEPAQTDSADATAKRDVETDNQTDPGLSTEGESSRLTEDDTETGPELDPSPDVGREGDPFESMEDAFTERGVGEVDTEQVWQQLTDAKSRGSVTEKKGRTYAEVSKHSYCEQCEYFSEPPDIECSNDGTEIVEFLDMETVRVVDCPVVAERKELEDN